MDSARAAEQILEQHEYTDFKWITGADVAVARWVRFKCMFGCPSYGKGGSCPPQAPPLDACRELFGEYEKIAVIRFVHSVRSAQENRAWAADTNRNLVGLEQAAFRAGFYRAFALFIECCRLCDTCPGTRVDCTDKAASRPSPEALGVDVFATVRAAGYPIQTLSGFTDEMNRYAFLLVE